MLMEPVNKMSNDDFDGDDYDGEGYLHTEDDGNYYRQNRDYDNKKTESRTRSTTASTEVKSVLEAKRIHSGNIAVLGKIVTVSEMYVIETVLPPNDLVHKDAKFIQLEDIEKLDENERLDVILYDDMIENVVAGEVVVVSGNIHLKRKSLFFMLNLSNTLIVKI